jgi:hypothetical protein
MRRRVPALLLSIFQAASSTFGGDWSPPPVATSWETYEAAYPKKTVSAAALEIEGLAARLGIDAAPQGPAVADPEDNERVVRLRPDDGRERPDPEFEKRVHSTISDVGRWADREIAEPSDRIGPPPEAVKRFFYENAETLDALAAVAAGAKPIEWDLDVTQRLEARMPGYLGLNRLQRVLAARALLEMRAGDADSALVTIEGMWRLAGSLAEQPYLISHLIVIPQLRLVVGLLRKVDGPAFGWEQRLAERAFYEAFLVALQNDPWPAAREPEIGPTVETIARIYRRFVEGLIEKSPCSWTRDGLAHSWEVAVSGEKSPDDMIATVSSESIIDMLRRWQRLLIDSEMTALVLQARAEKAASREREWPARIPNLESSVCPGRFYSYRRAGGVTLAFEGTIPGEDRGLVLPVTFRGAPPTTPTATPTVTRMPPPLTPTPAGGMMSTR